MPFWPRYMIMKRSIRTLLNPSIKSITKKAVSPSKKLAKSPLNRNALNPRYRTASIGNLTLKEPKTKRVIVRAQKRSSSPNTLSNTII